MLETIVLTLLAILFISVPVLYVVVLISTKKKSGEMGINREPVYCPKCGERAPEVRKPRNTKQLLWGGWTCNKCACEFDKWGKELQ